MPKLTICTVCKTAPRAMHMKSAHCVDCARRLQKEKTRKLNGTDPAKYRPSKDDLGARLFPLGQCMDCGDPIARNGRCLEHARQHHNEWRRTRGTTSPRRRKNTRPVFLSPVDPTPPPVPVVITGRTVQRIVTITPEEQQRQAEMDAWFRARGLA